MPRRTPAPLPGRFEKMPDPQFNHECPACGADRDPVVERIVGNRTWRTCVVCGEAEGVLNDA